ncbi:T9SS type A sorting domain-containing protein [Lentimicrobium sp. L6]|uniref:GEVED domain-containing protein n=1 Tax=Lentimicrobium sp. L6 TaxID=2735916 RepID=UPI001554C652|nr:GEVED domain-containing protein [Lentimicrobium sp. L6]NPD84112.1 T9SS type A sorting domain-containing protein [Lentimicrobium sp. L6]
MKQLIYKLNLITLAVLFAFNASAQTYSQVYEGRTPSKTTEINQKFHSDWGKGVKDILFSEDFSNNGFNNWTATGDAANQWTNSSTNYVGEEAPELILVGYPDFTGTTKFVSPVINTSGFAAAGLSFVHRVDPMGTSQFWVGVETTSDGGQTWNEVWTHEHASMETYLANEVINIDNGDMGSENFQFCFVFSENSESLMGWLIDDITLGDPLQYDVTPINIDGLDYVYNGNDALISTEVNNNGSETVSFDVKLEIDNGTNIVFTSIKEVSNLEFGGSANINFDAWLAETGEYTATVTTLLDGDESPSNDVIYQEFTVYESTIYCIPSADCSLGDGISGFAFADMENYNNGCSDGGYGDFTSLQASVEIGETYTASFISDYSTQVLSIWVDFNQDFTFQSTELILADFLIESSGTVYEVDIPIPGYALPGSTTMRVGARFSAVSSPDPCATFLYGEWEDYSIEITGESINLDASVISIDMETIIEPGDLIPVATFQNKGIQPISFPVTCSIEGSSYTSTKEVTELGYGETIQIEFDVWNAATGSYTIEVSSDLDGDEVVENNTLSHDVIIAPWVPEKMVVGEEGTGTWCGWCIRGHVLMDSLKMKYPDTWIGIAVHNGDPMLVPEYDEGLGAYVVGYPSGAINRDIVVDPLDFEAAYLAEIEKVAPASIIIEDKVFNEESRELTFTLTSEFIVSASNYRFNAVIMENEVTGTGAGWDQANYYSEGAVVMGGYENLPNPVPAEDMIYQDVARAILGGFEGEESSLPGIINAGETHSWEFSTIIDEEWDIDHIEVVGMLLDYNTGEIMNATKNHLLVTSVSGLKTIDDITIYPNPAKDKINIANMERGDIHIYTLNGVLVKSIFDVEGDININIAEISSGIYFVKAILNKQTITKKLVIE